MTKRKAPSFLTVDLILAIHEELLAVHGGALGVRDAGLLESALARPKHHKRYGGTDIFMMAAAYAEGIVQNHPFVDGNKRTGFLAAVLFLETNGYEFFAAEEEVVAVFLALAEKKVSLDTLAAWLKNYSR